MIGEGAYGIISAGPILRVFDPQSPHARGIFNLGLVSAIILAVVFFIVAGSVVFALMRFRLREGEPDPTQVPGNKRIEITWTAIPCVIVLVLFALTARTMNVSDPPPAPAPDVVIVGHQWWWEARYTRSGAVVANELHIPVGKALSVRLDSGDVLHEFWVPELARKMTLVPGHPNNIWLESDRPGTYLGVCSEFCGTQHAWMHFLVVVEPQSDFDAWEQAQLKPASGVDGEAGKGQALFQQLSCMSCHAVKGTAATAGVGPDLTHFASRRQIGAGISENTPENLRRWLADPQQVKIGVHMPNFKFTDAQLAELTAYLETLK